MRCDGFCLVTDYVEERDGNVTYVGHGVTGYDADRDCYLQHWTDTMGGMPADAKPGTWVDDTLTFYAKGHGGEVRYVYRVVSPTSYEFRIENSADGTTWVPFMDAIYERQPEEPAREPKAKKSKRKAKAKAKPTAKKKAKAAAGAKKSGKKTAKKKTAKKKKAGKKAAKKAAKKAGKKKAARTAKKKKAKARKGKRR